MCRVRYWGFIGRGVEGEFIDGGFVGVEWEVVDIG